ncbi:hypothetical protein lerEdw1_005472 [Lerista edwardsae]|nr:hypothetical protein lerEdw1_005472 [Lerista edwardsae]
MEISWLNLVQLLLAVTWGLGSLVAPAGAQNVHCYGVFDTTTGACSDLLGDEVTQADCCLNQKYGFRLHKDAPCQACRPAEWSEWSPWSSCSVSCTEGVRQRKQTCYGQGACVGGPRRWELQACNLKDCCPVMGGWSEWGAWTPCSVTCLSGTQTRERSCTNPIPQCGGDCPGNKTERRSCDTNQICPMLPFLLFQLMGIGEAGATGRTALPPACLKPHLQSPDSDDSVSATTPHLPGTPPGNRCPGDSQDHRDCEGLPYCPQDGNWGPWKPSSECSVTCGVGRVLEKRVCDSPAPKHGGRNCLGDNTRVFICNTKTPCPVDGRLTEWTAWTACGLPTPGINIACDDIHAVQKRSRVCSGRAHNGKFCPESKFEMRNCYHIDGCRLPGTWTDWSPWSLCEPPCGPNPMKSRRRECKPIYPNYPLSVTGGDGKTRNVSFWGTPRLSCQPLNGQRLLLEDKVPCQNVIPCEGEVLVTLLGRRKALCMLDTHLQVEVGKEFLSMFWS